MCTRTHVFTRTQHHLLKILQRLLIAIDVFIGNRGKKPPAASQVSLTLDSSGCFLRAPYQIKSLTELDGLAPFIVLISEIFSHAEK